MTTARAVLRQRKGLSTRRWQWETQNQREHAAIPSTDTWVLWQSVTRGPLKWRTIVSQREQRVQQEKNADPGAVTAGCWRLSAVGKRHSMQLWHPGNLTSSTPAPRDCSSLLTQLSIPPMSRHSSSWHSQDAARMLRHQGDVTWAGCTAHMAVCSWFHVLQIDPRRKKISQ